MEACGSAHHWGRELQELGHTVRLLPPADVARYREASPCPRSTIAYAPCTPEGAEGARRRQPHCYLKSRARPALIVPNILA
jgi:hypothetical protein